MTHRLTASSQLVGFFNRRTKLRAERGPGADRPLEAAWFQRLVNVPMKAGYRNAVGSRMFVNAQAAHWSNRFPLYPTQTRSSSVEGLPAGRLEVNTGDYTNAYDYYHFRALSAAASFARLLHVQGSGDVGSPRGYLGRYDRYG